MRIAYVSYADYGGPLVHTREFVKALSKMSTDLVVSCPFLDKDLSYVRALPDSPMSRIFANFPAWMRQLKLEIYQLRKLLRDFHKRHYYRELYQKSGLDIVIVRHDAFVLGAIQAAVGMGIPYILEVNGILAKHSPDRITRWFENYVFKHAGGIYAVTDSLGKLLVYAGAAQNKIRIIPNGVSLERFSELTAKSVPASFRDRLNRRIAIGYVGTFTAYHDTELLVDAFALAQAEVKNLCLVLVGEGRNDRLVQNYVAKNNLQNDVIFTGKVSYDSVPNYLKSFAIAANPVRKIYQEDFHGVPIKIFEYMAAGLPVVSTDMPNLRRLFKDALVFVPQDQPEKWAKVFVELAKNEGIRRQKGREAYNYLVRNDFTWDRNAEKVYAYCQEIVNRNVIAR